MSFARAALHLGGLWALAFAQPLFDLLGRNAQFFVARGSTTGDILLLAFGYVLVPPLAGAALVWALGRIRPEAGWWAMLVLVALLVAALLLPPAGDALGGSAARDAGRARAGCGRRGALRALRAACARSPTVLSPAPLIVLLLFLVVSPVRGLLFPDEASGAVAGPVRSSTPIVHVVLDELPQATLVDARGRDRRGAVPELRAARARVDVVPQRDDRRRPHDRGRARAADRDGPAPGTDPDDARPPAQPVHAVRGQPRPDRGRADHGPLPRPPVRRRAAGHRRPAASRSSPTSRSSSSTCCCPRTCATGCRRSTASGRASRRSRSSRRATCAAARTCAATCSTGSRRTTRPRASSARSPSLEQRHGARPPLLFLHSTLPHGGWRYLPDGRQYPVEGLEYIGLASEGWVGPQWQVDQGFQRHVLQVQYVDTLRRAAARRAARARPVRRRGDRRRRRPRRVVRDRRAAAAGDARQRRRDRAACRCSSSCRGSARGASTTARCGRPTCCRRSRRRPACGCRGGPTGCPPSERRVDPGARIDVSHAGEPAVSESLGYVLAKRRGARGGRGAAAARRALRDRAAAGPDRPAGVVAAARAAGRRRSRFAGAAVVRRR